MGDKYGFLAPFRVFIRTFVQGSGLFRKPGNMVKRLLHTLLISLACLLSSFTAHAQLDQVLRLEFTPNEDDNILYNVVSLESEGLLLTTQTVYPKDGNHVWTIARYDTLLNRIWERTFKIDPRMAPTKVYKDAYHFYVLLTQRDELKIQVFRLDYRNGDQELIEGTTLAYIDVTDFKVLSNTAYIGGLVKYRPVVVAFNFFEKRSRVLPALYEPNQELDEMHVDTYQNAVDIVLYSADRRKCELSIKSFDYAGRMLKNVTVDSEREKSLQTGKISPLNANEQFLMGNYSVKCSPYAQGMYMTKFNGDQQEFIKYYKFNDFENFFNFMKPKRKARVRGRIVKKRENGKEYQLRYRVLLHDIIEKNDQYILIGEAFYPQYRSGSVYGGWMGRGYNDRIFDGYKYTHAVVSGFDKKGNLLWDNCFEINNVVNYDLIELVKVAVDEDKITLVYPKDGELHTKLIKGNKVVKETENFPIQTNFEHDKVLNSEDVNVSEWYGKYFITWGYQEISNRGDAGVKPNREVFYLNKITYRAEGAAQVGNRE